MELFIKMKIDNLYKSKDYQDKKTGEVTPGKWKVQSVEKFESANGDQMKLIEISIPEKTAQHLKDKLGEVVTIPVGTFVTNNRVGYYGL